MSDPRIDGGQWSEVSVSCDPCKGEGVIPPTLHWADPTYRENLCVPCEGTGFIAHHQWHGPILEGPPPEDDSVELMSAATIGVLRKADS